jgi:hypothetical protein
VIVVVVEEENSRFADTAHSVAEGMVRLAGEERTGAGEMLVMAEVGRTLFSLGQLLDLRGCTKNRTLAVRWGRWCSLLALALGET